MSIIAEKDLLFKRAKTGKIQSYRILVKYNKDNLPEIVKQTGQIDGKKISHNEVVAKGKNIGRANETSAKDQAVLQMESDWKKKRDEGYKSLEDLGYTEPFILTAATPPEAVKEIKEFLEGALSQFNTDASGNEKPMLAKSYTEKTKLDFPVFGQPKLDGVRSLAIVHKTKDTVTILSRNGKKYKVPHIQAELKKLIPYMTDEVLILDGEIYNHVMEFEEIISAVKAIKKETEQLKFCAYDIADPETPFEQRFHGLNSLSTYLNKEIIAVVPTFDITSADKIEKFHLKCLENGYEGAMLRVPSGKYEFGGRSSSLLKVKKFDELEYPIIKFDVSGHRGVQDLKAVCETPEGKKFHASMNGSKVHKEALYEQWKAGEIKKGDLVTVEYFGLTNGKVPRFPKGKTIRNYE